MADRGRVREAGVVTLARVIRVHGAVLVEAVAVFLSTTESCVKVGCIMVVEGITEGYMSAAMKFTAANTYFISSLCSLVPKFALLKQSIHV